MVTDIAPTIPAGIGSRFTGEQLLRRRPRTYFRIVALLAEDQPITYIEKACKVSEHTVKAIALRRMDDVAERKKTILANLSDVAVLGSERMATTVHKASFRDATIGTGVAVDKILAITGQAPVAQVAIVNMPSESERAERREMHDKLDAIAKRLALPE